MEAIVVKCRLFILLAAVLGLAGCESREPPAEDRLPAWYQGSAPVLRVQADSLRARLWVLTETGVEVYDVRERRKLARVELRDWVWAAEPFAYPPDLALGANGAAIVSSNVLPILWRVAPETLAVTRHEVALDSDLDKDVGFSALTWSPVEGALYGTNGADGSLWRIEADLERGRKVGQSAPASAQWRPAPRGPGL